MPSSVPAATAPRWRIRVLGRVQADDGAQTIERFGSAGVAALLARLAMQPARRHAREEPSFAFVLWNLPRAIARLRRPEMADAAELALGEGVAERASQLGEAT